MKITTTLSRSLLLVCLIGLLSACGSDEEETQTKTPQEIQAEIESHGHSHD